MTSTAKKAPKRLPPNHEVTIQYQQPRQGQPLEFTEEDYRRDLKPEPEIGSIEEFRQILVDEQLNSAQATGFLDDLLCDAVVSSEELTRVGFRLFVFEALGLQDTERSRNLYEMAWRRYTPNSQYGLRAVLEEAERLVKLVR